MNCLAKFSREAGLVPYPSHAHYVYACYLKSQIRICQRHAPWHCHHLCDLRIRVASHSTPRAPRGVAPGMPTNYCGCDIYIHSAIEVSDESSVHTVSDETKEAWEALFVPSASSHRDPNQAPTVVAPSTPIHPDEETPSIPETPRFDPDNGGTPPGTSYRSCPPRLKPRME